MQLVPIVELVTVETIPDRGFTGKMGCHVGKFFSRCCGIVCCGGQFLQVFSDEIVQGGMVLRSILPAFPYELLIG